MGEGAEIPAWLLGRLEALIAAGEPVDPTALQDIIRPSGEARASPAGAEAWWRGEPGPLLQAPEVQDVDLGAIRTRLNAGEGDELRLWRPAFLAGTWLARLRRAGDGDTLERYALLSSEGEDEMAELNGQSEHIHRWNNGRNGRIMLFEPTAAMDYLRFFCHFVRADAGAFRVVEPGDPRAEALVPDAGARARYEAQLKPLRATHFGVQGEVFLNATVHYGAALFEAEFVVFPDGRIEMLNDRELGYLDEALTAA